MATEVSAKRLRAGYGGTMQDPDNRLLLQRIREVIDRLSRRVAQTYEAIRRERRDRD